jgi:hypothetical protein
VVPLLYYINYIDNAPESNMTTTRQKAEKTYQAALSAVRAAESGSDLAAWEAANAVLANARTALIEVEAQFPTAAEVKREARRQWLRNTGHDVA